MPRLKANAVIHALFALLLGFGSTASNAASGTTGGANDWLTQAQQQASQQADAAALAVLWQHFSELTQAQQADALLLAAQLGADNGLLELARNYYLRRLQAQKPIRAAEYIQMARFFANQQEWQQVVQLLQNRWADFPTSQKHSARELLGLAQLNLAQPRQAYQTLKFSRHQTQALPYRRYNLAISQYQLGKTFEARQTLRQLSQETVFTTEQRLFRDYVRIQLAQHYLKYEQGALALPVLQSIDSQSPYAHTALLLLGWAALTPGGEQPACQNLTATRSCWIETDAQGRDKQTSRSSINQSFANLRAANQHGPSSDLSAMLETALTSWRLLLNKPLPKATAMQPRARLAQLEAQVAQAYALQALGQKAAAISSYQQALQQLEQQPNPPATDQVPLTLAQKLTALKQSIASSNILDADSKPSALAAIERAIDYRQKQQTQQQQKSQQQWQSLLLHYRKQAHIGLASLHAQISAQ